MKNLPNYSFEHYIKNDTAVLKAISGGETIGHLAWNKDIVENVFVHPSARGQGLATALAEEALRLHGTGVVFEPKMSPFRTNAGEAFAQAIGRKHGIAVPDRLDTLFDTSPYHRSNFLEDLNLHEAPITAGPASTIRHAEQLELFSEKAETTSFRLTGSQGARSRITIGRPASNISRRSGKTPAFILDLDQTIWDIAERSKAAEAEAGRILFEEIKPKKGYLTAEDWKIWNKVAADVEPIPEMVDFVKGLQESGIKPVIMTARDMNNLGMVKSTLKEYGISTDHLMLRGLSQAQQDLPSDKLKLGMMQSVSDRFNFLTMLDDSASNLKAAYRFGVPLTIQPEKKGFDSLAASLVRGAELSKESGLRGMAKAQRAVEPIVRAGRYRSDVSRNIKKSYRRNRKRY